MNSSAVDETYTYGSQTYPIPENGQIRIEDCPSSIADKMRQASFEQEADNVFVKTRPARDDSDKEYLVVRITIDGPVLNISAEDNVGIVSLTPQSKLKINPKIAWSNIFDMLLAVNDLQRTDSYHGIPLDDILDDDINLEDLFIILSINYLQGIERIHRNGFLRDLKMRRTDLDHPRGVIDIERSLLNQAEGRMKQHCLLKEVDHDNAANSLLHHAGKHLLRLFRQHESKYDEQVYYRIFSRVHQEVQHLEELGVTSDRKRMPEYQHFSMYDLPKQRNYYRRAVEVAKSIVTTSLGTPALEGHRELILDYVIKMSSLFEEYSQVAIDEELDKLDHLDRLHQLKGVNSERSPPIHPFDDEQAYHQPDHAIKGKDDSILTVLDSKYYAEENNPVLERDPRSQMFSYAYLMDTERMCFLTPLATSKQYTVSQTEANVQLLAPEGDEFSLIEYHQAIREYLLDVLTEEYPVLEIFQAVDRHALCLEQATPDDLSDLTDPYGPFSIGNIQGFSQRVVNEAGDSLSKIHRTRDAFEQEGGWTRNQIETECSEWPAASTTCVPVFRREDGNERIDLYFAHLTDEGTVEDVTVADDYHLL